MKDISRNEKYAIVHVLSRIMSADGIIHPKEEEYMNLVYSDLGISIGDIECLSDINDAFAKKILNDMSESHKKWVVEMFLSMAKSDGIFHPNEKAIIENIFENK
jgi:uncharacterized tellurite resistance protein B-like protein